MHNFRKLDIWIKARQLSVVVYRLSSMLPKEEMFGLTSQLRRASISISSNIAEGAGRFTNKEFIRFLDIANGSCYEVESLLIISTDLEFFNHNDIESILSNLHEIEKMIYSFQQKLGRE